MNFDCYKFNLLIGPINGSGGTGLKSPTTKETSQLSSKNRRPAMNFFALSRMHEINYCLNHENNRQITGLWTGDARFTHEQFSDEVRGRANKFRWANQALNFLLVGLVSAEMKDGGTLGAWSGYSVLESIISSNGPAEKRCRGHSEIFRQTRDKFKPMLGF